jgi:acetolactate synthase I/II/III large subunit
VPGHLTEQMITAGTTIAIKGSDYIARFLKSRGVRVIFELSGGMIVHMLDSISRNGQIRIVSVHHEQAAAFAADAVGRLTGVPGVAMATSGPGATNLLTGIGSCYFDSSPAIFITGQVNRHEQKGSRSIRQLGFQETDIVSMAKPITKAAWQVQTPEDLPRMLADAFSLATRGRPGPVLVDVPMDVQRIVADYPTESVTENFDASCSAVSESDLEFLTDALQTARCPLMLAGGGVRAGQSVQLLRSFARLTGVPVVTSLMGLDTMPYNDPLRVGMIGSYGNRWANLALGRCDFLMVLGSRLDVRQTGSETIAFKGEKSILHVDCEPGEINNRVLGCHAVTCELRPFLKRAADAFRSAPFPDRGAWIEEIRSLQKQWPDTQELESTPGINPNVFMHQLSQAFQHASAYVVDVGQHQMWAAQSLELGPDQRFLTSGGMGSMGFALPAALGAAVADGLRPVVVIAGDGGFQCNIQELQTAVRNCMPLRIVVVDNGCHGMVRQFQESYFESRYYSTLWGYDSPDFARVATAYGVPGRLVRETAEIADGLEWLCRINGGPALLHLKIDTFANAYPKIAFGRPITEMEPMAKPVEQEGT